MNKIHLHKEWNQLLIRDSGNKQDIINSIKQKLCTILSPLSEHWATFLLNKTHKQIITLFLIENKEWKILLPKYWYHHWKFHLPGRIVYNNDFSFDSNEDDQIILTEQEFIDLLKPTLSKITNDIKLPLNNCEYLWAFNDEKNNYHSLVFKPETVKISKQMHREYWELLRRKWKRIEPNEILTNPLWKNSDIKNIIREHYNISN